MSPNDRFEKPSDGDYEAIRRTFQTIKVFQELGSAMPASYMAVFLAVALEPGLGVSAYADKLGMLRPVCSRAMLEMGKKARTGGPGLELLDSQQDSQDLRAVHYFLTHKGRRLLDRLVNARRLI